MRCMAETLTPAAVLAMLPNIEKQVTTVVTPPQPHAAASPVNGCVSVLG